MGADTTLLAACAAAFGFGAMLTGLIRRAALSLGTLDVPNARSSHTTPTPRGGGMAFVLVTLTAALGLGVAVPAKSLAAYAACAFVIAAVSLFDDVRSLPASIRLLVHIAAAGAFVAAVSPLPAFPLLPAWVAATAGAFWIVSATNIFNFMDGIDGIAASQGAIVFGAMGLEAMATGQRGLAALCFVAGAAVLGFLTFNWPPASIFMGDVGSAFLGFSCASLPLLGGDARLVGVTIFAAWPFLFDATVTLTRRLLRGENITQSHRSHLYQRLVIAGWPHRNVTSLYAAGALCSSAAGLLAARGALSWPAAGLVPVALASAIGLAVSRAERRPAAPRLQR